MSDASHYEFFASKFLSPVDGSIILNWILNILRLCRPECVQWWAVVNAVMNLRFSVQGVTFH
jgi:hypothetical protein